MTGWFGVIRKLIVSMLATAALAGAAQAQDWPPAEAVEGAGLKMK